MTMRRPIRTLLGIALPVFTIGVFFVLLAFSLLRLYDIEHEMGIEASPNMLWVVSRAHVSSLRLSTTINRFVINDSSSSQLMRNYDVFLSRLNLLEVAPQRRRIKALGFADELAAFRSRIPELKSRITNLQPHAFQTASKINALLTPFNMMLGRAANKAMIAQWDRLGNMLDATRKQIQQIIISLIGILLAGAVLTLHFLLAIREARQRTHQLNQEKALSELLVHSSGEGIVSVDLASRCTIWNWAAEGLFNQSADLALGRQTGEVSDFFEIKRVKQAIHRALGGKTTTLDDQILSTRNNEAPRYLDLRCFPLRDEHHIIGAILLIFDVTDRRAEQREVAMHRDHLEQLVQDRTKELDAALERERATAELYRNFGAMISHQFRTPLTIVDSAMQRLMRRKDNLSPAEIRERSNKAREAIARLVELIESTLDAERLHSGQVESRSQIFDLRQMAADVCQRQREATTGKTIVVRPSKSEILLARGDPAHVEHILINLLSNATKYATPHTTISVVLRAHGEEIECAITNETTFDSAAVHSMLFDRYYRGDNTEGQSGIGLGLYIARTLARMQGGDVRLADNKSGTVTFIATLPLASSSDAPERAGRETLA